jgi:hypothetical protein
MSTLQRLGRAASVVADVGPAVRAVAASVQVGLRGTAAAAGHPDVAAASSELAPLLGSELARLAARVDRMATGLGETSARYAAADAAARAGFGS